jgi:hypothetical protein
VPAAATAHLRRLHPLPSRAAPAQAEPERKAPGKPAVFKKKFTMIKCCKGFVYAISGNSMAFMKFKYAEIFQY